MSFIYLYDINLIYQHGHFIDIRIGQRNTICRSAGIRGNGISYFESYRIDCAIKWSYDFITILLLRSLFITKLRLFDRIRLEYPSIGIWSILHILQRLLIGL